MSWTFAGISFKTDFKNSYPDLLGLLDIEFSNSTEGFTFSDAISSENKAVAVGSFKACMMLVHSSLPYDCSFEPNEYNPLDEKLLSLSKNGNILVYIFDGRSETYCFSVFSNGKRIRQWAKDPTNTFCNEGEATDLEKQSSAPINPALPHIFQSGKDEKYLLGVWEAFHGVPFRDLEQNDSPLFTFFI